MLLLRPAALTLTLALAGLPAAAWAQQVQFTVPGGAQPNSDQLAREHFARGRDAFSNGDFATAAREFDQAYQLSNRPQLLYNIGTAYERLHNWNEANVAFHRYLDLVPAAADRAEVEARIRAIEIELAHIAEAREVQTNTSTRVVVVERQVGVPVDPPRPWRTAFWITGGLTVVAGGVTLATGLIANGRYNTLVSTCGARPQRCDQENVDDMALRQTIVNAGIITTSVFAAATVTFFILDLLRPAPRPIGPIAPTVHAGVLPLPGGGLVAVEGAL